MGNSGSQHAMADEDSDEEDKVDVVGGIGNELSAENLKANMPFTTVTSPTQVNGNYSLFFALSLMEIRYAVDNNKGTLETVHKILSGSGIVPLPFYRQGLKKILA